MGAFFEFIGRAGAPFCSPFLALAMPFLAARRKRGWLWAAAAAAVFFILYRLIALSPAAYKWLSALESPLFAVYIFVVLPALLLPPGPWRRAFLVVPAACLLLFALNVVHEYLAVPAGLRGFFGLPARPGWVMAAVASLLVLLGPVLSITAFRRCVRACMFFILIYGGFMLRQNFSDYQAMLSRRAGRGDVMTLSETLPVLWRDGKMLHVPSAPCRFSTDGGYVQGCNLELLQRVFQLNAGRVAGGDPGEVHAMGSALASLLVFFALCFISARWFCGWVCPLSAMGDLLDWARSRLRLPRLNLGHGAKTALRSAGLAFAGLGLAMAAAYPHLDAQGKFAGCKIPIYPLCKLCPGQQLCPVAGAGLGAYPPLPGMEWAFGLFRYGCIALLVFFVISFAAARRMWCLFCPMGMLSGFFNRGALFTLSKNAVKCNGCGICAEVCPMSIGRVRDELKNPDVGSFDCVLCLKCVEACPRDGCLSLDHAGTKIIESKYVTRRRV